MRLSMFIGIALIVAGVMALYQTRNAFFMFALGYVTHSAPGTEAEAETAFDALGSEVATETGATIAGYARARLQCSTELSGIQPNEAVATAFLRLNQILVGVGVNSFASVIPPGARRLAELRPDLTMIDRLRPAPDLNARDFATAKEEMDTLLEPENPIYSGVDLFSNFGHLDLLKLFNTMEAGGQGLFDCVEARRF